MKVLQFVRLNFCLKIALITLTPITWAQANQELIEVSDSYITNYLTHLDQIGATKSERQDLDVNIETKTKDVRDLNASIGATNRELSKTQSNLDAIPAKISSHEREITVKDKEAKRIFRDNFAGSYGSVEEAVQDIKSQERVLTRRRSNLVSELNVVKTPYERRISAIEIELASNERSLSQDLEPRRATLKSEVREGRQELVGLNEEIDRVQRLMDRPRRLNKRIKEAEAAFDVANKARIAKGKSCGGLSPIFSGTCRRYIEARNNLNNLKRIKSGERIRELRRGIKPKRREQAKRKERLEDLKEDIESLKSENRTYRGNLVDLRRDLNSATLNVEIEIEEVDLRLARLSTKVGRINRIEALRNDVNFRRGKIDRLREDQRNLPGDIVSLRNSIESLNGSLSNVEALLEGVKSRKTVILSALGERKSLVQEEQNVLSDLISELVANGEL